MNQHSEKRFRHEAPHSEISNGWDARPSGVLSEVTFYHQSLSEISCRQLQLLGGLRVISSARSDDL